MSNESCENDFCQIEVLNELGLSAEILCAGINYTHALLDKIDEQLISFGESRLAELLELANLSAVIGNLLRGGISKHSNGKFIANGPHKYPDILSNDPSCEDIEIKVALENNKPKGHLVKPGPHLTCRYVLVSEDGKFERGKENRGIVPRIWEIRVGRLTEEHFNVSNTEGDSGKTAVINAEGMEALKVVYCNFKCTPLSPRGKLYKDAEKLFKKSLLNLR